MEIAQCLVNSLVGEDLACGGSWKVVVARQWNLSALTTGRLLRYVATPLVVAVIAVVLFPTSSSSSTTTSVAGVSSEGPASTVTGTYMTGNHWLQLDEQLGAGQRLVLSGAFLADLAEDLTSAIDGPIWIGLPSGAWSNTAVASVSDASMWLGGVYFALTYSAWMDNPYGLFVRKGTRQWHAPFESLDELSSLGGAFIELDASETTTESVSATGRRLMTIRQQMILMPGVGEDGDGRSGLRHYERRCEDLFQTPWLRH